MSTVESRDSRSNLPGEYAVLWQVGRVRQTGGGLREDRKQGRGTYKNGNSPQERMALAQACEFNRGQICQGLGCLLRLAPTPYQHSVWVWEWEDGVGSPGAWSGRWWKVGSGMHGAWMGWDGNGWALAAEGDRLSLQKEKRRNLVATALAVRQTSGHDGQEGEPIHFPQLLTLSFWPHIARR